MNYIELINKIKKYTPAESIFEGDVYENWNSSEIKYCSVNIGLEETSYNGNSCTYSIILYYGDRLLQDKSNRTAIITDGTNIIQSTLNGLDTEDYINIEEPISYIPFEQKFNDYLAGVYARVRITTDSPIGNCEIDEHYYSKTLDIKSNGEYIVTDYDKVNVDVRLEIKPSTLLAPSYNQFVKDTIDSDVEQGNYDFENFVWTATDNYREYKGLQVPDGLDYSIRGRSGFNGLFAYTPILYWKADLRNCTTLFERNWGTDALVSLPRLKYLEIWFPEDLSVAGQLSFGNGCPNLEVAKLYNFKWNHGTSAATTLFNTTQARIIDFGDGCEILGATYFRWQGSKPYLEEVKGVMEIDGEYVRIDSAPALREIRIKATFAQAAPTANNQIMLNGCPNLSYESLKYLIDNIANPPAGSPNPRLDLGATNIAKLTPEDIAIATSKGWSII